MFRFLSAEALYGLLLVTTFASVGLLGLWAATSRWHPFVRTTIVLGILSVLLLRPMFEPFVMLIPQVATIAVGVTIYRWLKNRKQETATDRNRTRYQFSLKTLLFVSTLVAIGAAVVAKLPDLGGSTWVSITAIGFNAGFGTLLSVAWFQEGPVYFRLATAFSGPLCNAVALGAVNVPYEQNYRRDLFKLPGYDNWPYVLIGFGLLLTMIQLVIALLWKGRLPEGIVRKQNWLKGMAILLTAGVFILPGYVTMRLLNPLPPPPRNPMKPNSYNRLARLGHEFIHSPLMTVYNADPLDKKLLAQEVANHAAELEKLDAILNQQAIIPDVMQRLDLPVNWARSLARVLESRGDTAREAGDFDTALKSNADLLLLARRIRGGLLFDWMLSLGFEQNSIEGTYRLSNNLGAEECKSAIEFLLAYDLGREPLGEVFDRQRRWNHNAKGWRGHLATLFVKEGIGSASLDYAHLGLHFNQALNRLLVTELALRKYQLTHNSLPDNLDQLVPDILPEVPGDPFDPAGGTLRYQRTENGYILYSVCKNGIDDGGIPPNEEGTFPSDWSSWWNDEHGDLRLDHFFAEPEPDP